jgi:hypothetical protein
MKKLLIGLLFCTHAVYGVHNQHKVYAYPLAHSASSIENNDHHSIEKCCTNKNRYKTDLYLASERGCNTCVKQLINNHHNPHQPSEDNLRTPLHIACEKGHSSIVSQLTQYGAHINAEDPSNRWTPLYCASLGKHHDIARQLLVRGAQPNIVNTDSFGYTPLHYTSRKGYSSVLNEILIRGGNPDIRNQHNEKPIEKTLDRDSVPDGTVIGKKALCMKMLYGYGADITDIDPTKYNTRAYLYMIFSHLKKYDIS